MIDVDIVVTLVSCPHQCDSADEKVGVSMRMHERAQAVTPAVTPAATPAATSRYTHLLWLPNALTRSRLVLSPAILLCAALDHLLLAVTLFVLCGLTDAIDGTIARALSTASANGARLDSLADAVLFTSALLATALTTDLLHDPVVVFGIVLVGTLRAANLALTRLRFGTWDAMHTIGNKVTGFVVFGGILPVLMLGRSPRSLSVLLISVAFLSAVEELVLILRSSDYDPNTRGLGGRVLRARTVRPAS